MAHLIWEALGQPRHYIEPFFGSGAVLLNRPDYDQSTHVETVNDKDGNIANVWRSIQFSPDETARWCDWPVNHADLNARRKEIIRNENRLLEGLVSDPKWHDPVIAGYWIWAASCWIGSGLTRPDAMPRIADGGIGVHAIGKRPHLSDGGQGVHAIGQRPHLSDGGTGVHATSNNKIHLWFRQLSERLRRVRVVCGDWQRVCGGNWQDNIGLVGMFFDPPYGIENRDTSIYHHDSTSIALEVMAWVKDRGGLPSYRIVLAGYEEYKELLSFGWRSVRWKANGGYSNNGKEKNENRHRETLYFSPHCVSNELFGK